MHAGAARVVAPATAHAEEHGCKPAVLVALIARQLPQEVKVVGHVGAVFGEGGTHDVDARTRPTKHVEGRGQQHSLRWGHAGVVEHSRALCDAPRSARDAGTRKAAVAALALAGGSNRILRVVVDCTPRFCCSRAHAVCPANAGRMGLGAAVHAAEHGRQHPAVVNVAQRARRVVRSARGAQPKQAAVVAAGEYSGCLAVGSGAHGGAGGISPLVADAAAAISVSPK